MKDWWYVYCNKDCHAWLGDVANGQWCVCGQKQWISQMMYFPPSVLVTEPKSEASDNQKREAINAGASHISRDGKHIYMKRFGEVSQADWNGIEYGGWWSTGAMVIPSEAIELNGAK